MQFEKDMGRVCRHTLTMLSNEQSRVMFRQLWKRNQAADPNFFEWSILICSSRSNWLGNAIAQDLQV
jgi:hypothetical protein